MEKMILSYVLLELFWLFPKIIKYFSLLRLECRSRGNPEKNEYISMRKIIESNKKLDSNTSLNIFTCNFLG